MREIHKITLKAQLLHSVSIAILFAIILIAYICLVYNGAPELLIHSFAIVFALGFLLQFIPWLALHLDYFSINKNDVLEFDPVYKEVFFKHGDKQVTFSLDDIKVQTLYKSFALYKKNMQLLAFDNYNHTVIELNNGTKIVITSLLLMGDIKLPISKYKTRIKLNLYRWAKGPSLQLPSTVS